MSHRSFENAAQVVVNAAREPGIEAVLLFGQTAVGKSALLEKLSQYPIEVISADSRQVYRGFEISTAYPSIYMRTHVAHHLINILHFTKSYTVASFVKHATACIAQIRRRGNIPVVSGGTAYYLYHLSYGLPTTPPANDELRHALNIEAERKGLEFLYARLSCYDPIYARSIAATDKRRIIRALEIIEITGRSLDAFRFRDTQKTSNYAIIELVRARELLYERITKRVDEMYARGLVEEVYALYRQGLRLVHNASRTIGVQEFLKNCEVTRLWNKGSCELSEGMWQDSLRPQILSNTRKYAKRQATFFKQFKTAQRLVLDE